MSNGQPGPASDDGSALVSEGRVKRAIGNVTIKCFRIDAEPKEFGALGRFHEIWRSKVRGEDLTGMRGREFIDFASPELPWRKRKARSAGFCTATCV